MVDTLYPIQSETLQPSATPSGKRILAAIDIGTNSIHMVIVRIDPSLPAFTIISREKDTVRLGDRDLATGNLTPEAMERGVAALQRCRDLAKSFTAEQIVAVATSAVREAPNGRDFIERVKQETGITIDLISGQEEARRIYLGVLSAMEFNSQPHIIIDIGGGSTEIVLGDGQAARFLSSTKVGAVRLTREYIHTDPISEIELRYLQAYIRGRLERAIEELKSHLGAGESPDIVGTSGTVECLASIQAMQELEAIPIPLQGYELHRKNLEKIVAQLAALTVEERKNVPGISEKRAEIILAGALILLETMKMLGLESLVVCERALREGVIVDWMLTHGLIENRLRFQESVRERSVFNIARKYQVDLEFARRVAYFSLVIFDQTRNLLHDWGNQERELLWAAAILHNCGVYVSHSAHHKHSYYLIRNAELLGFTENEIEAIANIARYHRKSKPKKKHENYRNLLDKRSRQMVEQLSAILRLAVALDRRQIGAIASLSCHYDPDNRELHLELVPVDPDDDCALELWSIEDKKIIFQEEYGVRVSAKLATHHLWAN